jgi:uncharacterized protein YggL (DUF469 family)
MLVFAVWYKFDSALDIQARNALLDRWLAEAIESNGLQFGGGGSENEWEGVVETCCGRNVSDGERILVENWLRTNPLIIDYRIGPIVDDDKVYVNGQLVL